LPFRDLFCGMISTAVALGDVPRPGFISRPHHVLTIALPYWYFRRRCPQNRPLPNDNDKTAFADCATVPSAVVCVPRSDHLLMHWMGSRPKPPSGWDTPLVRWTRLRPKESFTGVQPRAISAAWLAVCGANSWNHRYLRDYKERIDVG